MASKTHTASLPSLRALHAFAKVARAGSAAVAAQSLGVTPSAVSHLLRELEERLGIGLFDRSLGRFTLTDEGRRLYQDVARAFDEIEESVQRALRQRANLRISTMDTFAQFWLIPRLSRFQADAPSVDLYISTTTRVVDLDSEGIDAAIRWGAGRWPHTRAELLDRDMLLPVAHPAVAARLKQRTPAALAQLPLVHAKTLPEDWNLWFRSVGHEPPARQNGVFMESRSNAILAALAGVGPIVVHPIFIKDDLAAKRLVPLSDIAVRREEGYWLAWSENRGLSGPLRQFSQWLKREFAHTTLDKGVTIIDATKDEPAAKRAGRGKRAKP